ncbi:hypothetical protein Ahy_A04g017821 [Arachis hypogaea]|uniref:Uncharacterized protein n=1 Tax=Arachis hypogaea TaxID=3818 RepID=A0A445DC88_ARAHY|nr:hypothetical protein Ahy_A04g017821 [Arachis hypogaea]
MLKVDELTSIHSRNKFARICVEIDLRKKIVPFFTTIGKDFNIVYEELHQICFNCDKYRHRIIEQCSKMMTKITTNTTTDSTEGRKPGGDEGNNEPEELVKYSKKERRLNRGKSGKHTNQIQEGNQEKEENNLDTTPVEMSEAWKDTQVARTSKKSATK